MQPSMIAKTLNARIVPHMTRLSAPSSRPCDVFINHRGIDTKRTIAGLLFQHLSRLGLKPFLDSKSLRPGDGLFEKIDPAIQNCQVGLAVFSQRYCESYFCLHELALMRESKKKVVPVFCDVKPSELQIKDNRLCSTKELERFHRALEEAKNIVGLTFDTINGDWSQFLTSATEAVIQSLLEVEENQQYLQHNMLKHQGPNFV